MSVLISFLFGFTACLILALTSAVMLKRRGKTEAKVKIFSTGFGEEERNTLKDAAKEQAEVLAKNMVFRIVSDVRGSAELTLRSIAASFGDERVEFEYSAADGPLNMRAVDIADDAMSAA